MPTNINCKHYQSHHSKCMHSAVPSVFIIGMRPECILVSKPSDPRIKDGCKLQQKYHKPDYPLRGKQ